VFTQWSISQSSIYTKISSGAKCLVQNEPNNPHNCTIVTTYILVSISSISSVRNFCTKFWRQKFQTQNTACVQNFGTKTALSYEKGTHKTLMKLTPVRKYLLSKINCLGQNINAKLNAITSALIQQLNHKLQLFSRICFDS